MARLLLLILLAGSAYAVITNNRIDSDEMLKKNAYAQWDDYKEHHNKNYDGAIEEVHRDAFVQNFVRMENHNKKFREGKASFEMGLNHMSDWTPSQYEQVNGFRAPPINEIDNSTVFHVTLNAAAKESVDWTYTTPLVKDQGQCGSCYAFSAMAALEGALYLKNKKQYNLSEQNILDCTDPYYNYGCRGGFMTNSYKYVIAVGGVDYAADYPYEAVQKTCRYKSNVPRAALSSYVRIPHDEAALTDAVSRIGPVAIALDASLPSFQMYKSGIYDDAACGKGFTHAVVIVGYGVDNGKEYFKIKNCWGKNWGEGGYMRIVKGKDMCGIASMASYPLV